MQVRWNLFVIQCQCCLNQPSHARSRLEMTDIGFHGSQCARPRITSLEDCGERVYLDWIAERRSRAVSLHVGHVSAAHARIGQRGPYHFLLGTAVRRGNHTRPPVLITGYAPNQGINPIAVGQRIRVNSVPVEVIGILESKGQGGGGGMSQDRDDTMVAPLSMVRNRVTGGNRWVSRHVSMIQVLVQDGYDVMEAGDGKQALAALKDPPEPVEVVMLDYRLPDTTGLKLLAAIRGLSPDSRVVMMTAYGTADVIAEAMRLGAVCVVNKPIEMQDVADLVSRARAS